MGWTFAIYGENMQNSLVLQDMLPLATLLCNNKILIFKR